MSAGSALGHSATSSASERTRSLSLVGFLSTSLHGLTATISCRIAQLKIADAAASVWLATIGASIREHHGSDIGAGDGGGLELAPARQQMAGRVSARPAATTCCASWPLARCCGLRVDTNRSVSLRLLTGAAGVPSRLGRPGMLLWITELMPKAKVTE